MPGALKARALAIDARLSKNAAYNLTRDAIIDWKDDKAPRISAALAYYALFSLAPLLSIVIGIAGLALGDEAAQGEVVGMLSGTVGPGAAQAVEDMIAGASEPGTGVAATVLGVILLLVGASTVFRQLRDALDTIWEVEPPKPRTLAGKARAWLLSFGLVFSVGFLLVVALVLSAALAFLGDYAAARVPAGPTVWLVVNFVVSLAVITLAFALLYRYVPDARIAWRDVWIGAAVTAVLFTIGKFALGVYLGQAAYESTYGAAGAIIAVLAWVYYAGLIFFLGAEFTQVYANTYGSRVRGLSGSERDAQREVPPSRQPRSV